MFYFVRCVQFVCHDLFVRISVCRGRDGQRKSRVRLAVICWSRSLSSNSYCCSVVGKGQRSKHLHDLSVSVFIVRRVIVLIPSVEVHVRLEIIKSSNLQFKRI